MDTLGCCHCAWKTGDRTIPFEMGRRPNLNYRDGNTTPAHWIAYYGHTETLKWAFTTENVLPLWVLRIKNEEKETPLDIAIFKPNQETKALLQRLIHNLNVMDVMNVFLAIQCAKRDYQCVLRRLPDELLDMVVDKVAARYGLKVVW